MIVIGLTGSIGMGKSTALKMFQDLGVPCHDSDACVHALMQPGGKACALVGDAFPQVYKEGVIDRQALGAIVFANPEERVRLENILHPLVRESQREFIAGSQSKVVVLDIPLLFETGAEGNVDITICVDAPHEIQRQRVLARPGMTEEKFAAILANQMSSSEKVARADYVVQTGVGTADTMMQIENILKEVLKDA